MRRKSKAGGLLIVRSPSEKGEVTWAETQRVTQHLAGGDSENCRPQTRTFLSLRARLNWFGDEYAIATVFAAEGSGLSFSRSTLCVTFKPCR